MLLILIVFGGFATGRGGCFCACH